MLAMLLAMTSRLVCWAFMPVAAMASAFMTRSLDTHATDFEVSRDDLVADGDGRLQRLLGAQHRIDHLAGVGVALERLYRHLLGTLQRVDGLRRGLTEDVGEAAADAFAGLRSDAALQQVRRRGLRAVNRRLELYCPDTADHYWFLIR